MLLHKRLAPFTFGCEFTAFIYILQIYFKLSGLNKRSISAFRPEYTSLPQQSGHILSEMILRLYSLSSCIPSDLLRTSS